MYRDLLLHVDGGPSGRGRVRFAAELAERIGARLSGLHVAPTADMPPLYKPSLKGRHKDDVRVGQRRTHVGDSLQRRD